MFTARYGLIPYIKQIKFRLLKVNQELKIPSLNPRPFAILTCSVMYCCCQKDERLNLGNVQSDALYSHPPNPPPRNKVPFTSPLSFSPAMNCLACCSFLPLLMYASQYWISAHAVSPLHSVLTVWKGCAPAYRSSARCVTSGWSFKTSSNELRLSSP